MMLFAITVLALAFSATPGHASIPSILHYQGVLTDGGGSPITTNTSVIFTLWSAPIAGTAKWTETRNITPDIEGRFAILLGQAVPLHDSVFKMPPLYLGVKVGADPEMTPRSLLASSAFAFRIATIDGATGGFINGGVELQTDDPEDGMGIRDPGGNVSSMTSTSTAFADANDDTIAQFGDVGLRFIEPSTNDTIFNYDPNTSSLEIGIDNFVSGSRSFALGSTNIVSGNNSFAIGTNNLVTQNNAFALGNGNDATGASSIASGTNNLSSGSNSAILAGSDNRSTALSTFVGGGDRNFATGAWGAIVGGSDNRCSTLCFVGGGVENVATGGYCAILGGITDTANGAFSAICAGAQNRTEGEASFIGAGFTNRADGFCATIPGGHLNRANGSLSFAAGFRAKADHKGSFVWADSTAADFATTAINQFLIRASGGVGIGTNAPARMLQVGSNIIPGTEGLIRIGSRETGPGAAARLWDIGVPQTGSVTTGKGYDFVIDDTFIGGTDPEAVFQWGSGFLGLGVLDPTNRITLPNVASTSGQGLANAWSVYSSRRWKTDIEPIRGALGMVNKLQGVTYRPKSGGEREIGLIAEEVGAVVPEVVQFEANGVDAQSVDYARLVALLIEGMKEQDIHIRSLQDQINELKNDRAR
jgi:hypothetical protein